MLLGPKIGVILLNLCTKVVKEQNHQKQVWQVNIRVYRHYSGEEVGSTGQQFRPSRQSIIGGSQDTDVSQPCLV